LIHQRHIKKCAVDHLPRTEIQRSSLNSTQEHNHRILKWECGHVTAKMSGHLITYSTTCITGKPNERFFKNTDAYQCSSGSAGPKIYDGECLSTTNSCVEEKASLLQSFGCTCSICDKLLTVEKEFVRHCSRHRFSPPDILFADL